MESVIEKPCSYPVLSVLIVGCGLSGLSSAIALKQAGHNVTIFERSSELHEVGAGIQLPPNATRLLQSWGVLDEVLKYAYQPVTGALRSYRGDVISLSPAGSIVESIYQVPYLVVHRADLLKALLAAATSRGVLMKLGCEVSEIDFSRPSLKLSTGEVFAADVILGADGVGSFCRSALLGRPDPPNATGDVVFRIAVQRRDIKEDHPSWELIKQPSVNVWMGPDAHCLSYLLRDDTLNVVLVHADNTENKAVYGPRPADLIRLKSTFSDWDPALQGLLDVKESDCTQWSLLEVNPVANWHHESGRFVLIGDAAHAVLPYLAQGAAQAFEDAGVLGGIFGQLATKDQIRDALSIIEQVRKPRLARVRQLTLAQKAMYGLADGPEQEKRDLKLASSQDISFWKWLWDYDAVAEGQKAWSDFLGAR